MGFNNDRKNFKILKLCKGDIEKAIQMLVDDAAPEKNQEFKKLKKEFRMKLI